MHRFHRLVGVALVLGACGDTKTPASEDSESTGDGVTTTQSSSSSGAALSTSGADSTGDGGEPTSAGESSSSSSDGGEPLPPDPCIEMGTCPPGEWIEVTPPELGDVEFGPGPVVVDPSQPSDLYMGGGGDGIWKSTDYGNTWVQIDDTIPYVPMGLVIAVAGTTPATVWVAGFHVLHKSTDGGASFVALENDLDRELYSIAVDPYDPDHLVSGLHEADGIVESIDGGATWTPATGAGFPGGGISWYPFFLDSGEAASTRGTWLAIAQDGGSATTTTDGGESWTIPAGIDGLQHPHGNAQIFQRDALVFVAGTGGPGGGIYRSTDMAASFERVLEGDMSIAWGTAENVYAMWGWACAGCDLGAKFTTAALPGDEWTAPAVPAELVIGANHMAVTSDGTHDVFVGTMWSAGVWRYVEP